MGDFLNSQNHLIVHSLVQWLYVQTTCTYICTSWQELVHVEIGVLTHIVKPIRPCNLIYYLYILQVKKGTHIHCLYSHKLSNHSIVHPCNLIYSNSILAYILQVKKVFTYIICTHTNCQTILQSIHGYNLIHWNSMNLYITSHKGIHIDCQNTLLSKLLFTSIQIIFNFAFKGKKYKF